MDTTDLKSRVKDHWEREVCGSRYGPHLPEDRKQFFEEIEKARYRQDYMLRGFARFEEAKGKRVTSTDPLDPTTVTHKMRWFRNIKRLPFDTGNLSLDYSLQLYEGIKAFCDSEGCDSR